MDRIQLSQSSDRGDEFARLDAYEHVDVALRQRPRNRRRADVFDLGPRDQIESAVTMSFEG
jgi:hypothetical protein